MYGLNQGIAHFNSFDEVVSLPLLMNQSDAYWYGMIGKKHIGPSNVYPFAFSYTEMDGYDLNQVGRNITFMNEKMQDFLTLAKKKKKPFFLYMAFFDAHRCREEDPFGGFCELYGDGKKGHGTIPDWTPKTYDPSTVEVPYFVPNSTKARADIAAQYRSVNRMDQGVGLFMRTLADNGFDDDTLIIFTSDNGIPFPDAKTNLYEPGMKIPLLISNPSQKQRWGVECFGRTTTIDLFLTIVDWFDLDYPKYKLNGVDVNYMGKSLIDATAEEPSPRDPNFAIIYSSHNFHGISMYYPMRVVREEDSKLIHNLNFKMPFPVAQDVFQSPTFQEIVGNTSSNGWFKDLHSYYYRSEWEFYDLDSDPQETKNLIDDPSQSPYISSMKEFLVSWQNYTNDPWLCMPGGEKVGTNGTCISLSNGL